jgi:flagellar hook-associated protein 1 FlgK
MADLLSLLSYGSNAISRTNSSISVTTNNVANVDTEGYSRQRTDDKTGDPVRVSSNLLSGQIQAAAGSLAMSQAFADALSELESGMTSGGTIDGDLGNLFSKMSSASAAPTDSSSRDAVIAAARALVSGIQRRAQQAATLRTEANQRIRDNAQSVTSLA